MAIESNAASDELNSPFYKKNEKLTNAWNDYVLDKDGEINGKFNAWSISVKCKVKVRHTWLIDIKKATYSNGLLIFSSKYQNLHESLTFRTLATKSDYGNFHFRNSRLRRGSRKNLLFKALTQLLSKGLNDGSLYEIKFKNSKLKIVFHHRNDWFEVADLLLDFNPNKLEDYYVD